MSTTAVLPPDELPLLGEPFAVELANTWYVAGTRDDRDYLDESALPSWWHHARRALNPQLPEVPPAAADLIALRDAVRALLLSASAPDPRAAPSVRLPSGPDRSGHLDAVLAMARRAPAFLTVDTTGPWRWRLDHVGDDADVALTRVAEDCLFLLSGPVMTQIRRCLRADCPMLFAQHHRSRTFCHRTCAQRVRQARYARSHPR